MKAKTYFLTTTQLPYLQLGLHLQILLGGALTAIIVAFIFMFLGYLFTAFISMVAVVAISFIFGIPFSRRNRFYFHYIIKSMAFWAKTKQHNNCVIINYRSKK